MINNKVNNSLINPNHFNGDTGSRIYDETSGDYSDPYVCYGCGDADSLTVVLDSNGNELIEILPKYVDMYDRVIHEDVRYKRCKCKSCGGNWWCAVSSKAFNSGHQSAIDKIKQINIDNGRGDLYND